MLNRAKNYYEHDEGRLRDQTRDKQRNLSAKEKKTKKERIGKKQIS